jgi:hypothetical protein
MTNQRNRDKILLSNGKIGKGRNYVKIYIAHEYVEIVGLGIITEREEVFNQLLPVIRNSPLTKELETKEEMFVATIYMDARKDDCPENYILKEFERLVHEYQ